MAVMVDKETKEKVPVTAFINADQLAKDVARINDAARGKIAQPESLSGIESSQSTLQQK